MKIDKLPSPLAQPHKLVLFYIQQKKHERMMFANSQDLVEVLQKTL